MDDILSFSAIRQHEFHAAILPHWREEVTGRPELASAGVALSSLLVTVLPPADSAPMMFALFRKGVDEVEMAYN